MTHLKKIGLCILLWAVFAQASAATDLRINQSCCMAMEMATMYMDSSEMDDMKECPNDCGYSDQSCLDCCQSIMHLNTALVLNCQATSEAIVASGRVDIQEYPLESMSLSLTPPPPNA